ncbi:hypothetical protein BH11PSE9_BH11PSE9_30880 [soil metagenome]
MSEPAATATPQTPAPLLVICLCAAWCGVCREYQPRFEQVAAAMPHLRFAWIDVEDEADLLDPIEVENFPTLLIARAGEALFFGTVTPQIETLEWLVRAHGEDDACAALADPELRALLQRLPQAQA